MHCSTDEAVHRRPAIPTKSIKIGAQTEKETPIKLEFLMEYAANLNRPTRDTGAGPFGTRGLAGIPALSLHVPT